MNKQFFGKTQGGLNVNLYTIESNGICAKILDYGATLQSLIVPSNDKNIDVVFGYSTISEYENNDGYLGAVIGRNSNRIANASFNLNGKTYNLYKNDNTNNLHGGKIGFDKKVWEVKAYTNDSITFTTFAADGEEGFPGNIKVSVKYSITDTKLNLEYFAESDADTPCNLTNHTYFNLNGEGNNGCLDNLLYLNSSFITPIDNNLCPFGEIKNIKNTAFDFTTPKTIGKDIFDNNEQLKIMGGYDVNYCLNNQENYEKIGYVYSPNTKILMNVYTDQMGIQVYSGNFLTNRNGKNGHKYNKQTSICLETQQYPNILNNPHFGKCILKAGEKYYTKTSYEFLIKE